MKICKCFIKRIISMVLAMTMSISLFSGCGQGKAISDINSNDMTDQIIYDVSQQIMENIDKYGTINTQTIMSYEWEDYIGDVETFVYGIIANDMKYGFEVFPASVTLENGLSVSGIGYTDYSTCYTNEEETECCFEAGFIANCGELVIPQDEIEKGLLIDNLDYQDETTSFLLAYQSDPFTNHCVVYNKYVKYGVDNEGCFFYEAEDYSKEKCDESLGSLFSYDENKYLLDFEVGNYKNLTGESLSSALDYESIENEINAILENQDKNFAQVDISTIINFSQEAVTNYLLSMQEETFLGYNVNALVEAAKQLDPMECYRITNAGLVTIDLEHSTEEQIARWLVGTACVIAVGVGIIGSVITVECPALSAVCSAAAGVGIEIFMQVVISNQTVADVDWRKVAIAAGAGAVSGFLGPYITASTGGAVQFLADSTIDGLIAGIEQSIFAWMDGEDGQSIIKSFGEGFALGFGLSAGFKAATSLVGKIVAPQITKLSKELFPNLTHKAKEFASGISMSLINFKKQVDGTKFHVNYLTKKIQEKQLLRLATKGDVSLKEKSFDKLTKMHNIFDADGNIISKEQLKKVFDNTKDNEIIGYLFVQGEAISVKKQYGAVGIVFDQTKYQTVTLSNGMTGMRELNLTEATKEFKAYWKEHPEEIPESIAKAIKDSNVELEKMQVSTLKAILQERSNGWVMHENIDLKTVTLVPRMLHDSVEGGATHFGGVSLASHLKDSVAIFGFERLHGAATFGVVQGVN